MPLWLLAAVFAALVLLTGLTVAVSKIDLGNLNLYVALAIAVIKASLVVLFFMHLFWDRPFNSMVFAGCLLFVSLFIGICLDRLEGQPAVGDRRPRLGDARRAYAVRGPAKMSDYPRSNGPSQRSASGPAAPPINAGELGMAAFIAALSSFFAASIVIYLLMRRMHQPWPPAGFPALPSTLWLSTLAIVFASVTMHGAVLAARRDDTIGLQRNLAATLILGLGFLGLQSYAWYAIWRQVAAVAGLGSAYLKMFYLMTGLHAAHVLGGLVPLAMVTVAAYQCMYGRKKNAAVRYTALYWHFLDAVWCAIFIVVYLI